MFKYCHNYI